VYFTLVRLTGTLKKKWYPQVVRQTGEECFHCHVPNSERIPLEWGHLNGNLNDSRPENFAFMCHPCNCKQRTNYDMIILANEQLEKNEKALLVWERTLADTGTENDLTSQQEINKTNMNITRSFLLEHTINESVVLRDAVNAIVDICQENNGTGSQSAIYRYVDSLANPFTGKYTICQNKEGKNIVRRRTEN